MGQTKKERKKICSNHGADNNMNVVLLHFWMVMWKNKLYTTLFGQ